MRFAPTNVGSSNHQGLIQCVSATPSRVMLPERMRMKDSIFMMQCGPGPGRSFGGGGLHPDEVQGKPG